MRVAFRQMAMTFAQIEKTRLVKLKVARDRASQKTGRPIEGRKGHARKKPELAQLATSIWKEGRTLLAKPAILAERSYATASCTRFSASQVKRLFEAE